MAGKVLIESEDSYLTKLLDNKEVVRYLKQRQPEVLAEFETIVQAVSLEQ